MCAPGAALTDAAGLPKPIDGLPGRGTTTSPASLPPHLSRNPRPPPTASKRGMSLRQALGRPRARSQAPCCRAVTCRMVGKRATGTACGPCCTLLYLCTSQWPPQSVRNGFRPRLHRCPPCGGPGARRQGPARGHQVRRDWIGVAPGFSRPPEVGASRAPTTAAEPPPPLSSHIAASPA